MTELAMPELRSALVDAARVQHDAAMASRGDRGVTRIRARGKLHVVRRARVRAVVVLVLLLLAAAAAAFASGLISFGSPAVSVPVFANPRVGLGNVAHGSVQLLPISVPDPHGGPPWGMRVLSTTRGAGCLQVGRLVDGRLAALGQDGAFGNDGLAHELPLSTNIERLNCSLVDRHGRLFDSVTIKSQAASAAPGVHCRPPGTYAPSSGPAPYVCPLADERNLYYGMLGPDATSLTYTLGGQTRTVATVGSDGAYLIVTTGTTHRYTGAAGTRERAGLYVSDDVPIYSPITAIHYRGGVTCHLVTATRWVHGPGPCSPAVPEPFGYVQARIPTKAQLATPVRARLIRGAGGGWDIRIRFTSRVAIASLRGEYLLQWHDAGEPHHGEAFQPIGEAHISRYDGLIPQGENIRAGQTLTATIIPRGLNAGAPGLAPGMTAGRVSLQYGDGTRMQAAEDTVHIPVGTFTIRVP
jgi:hypothetical protein